MVRCLVIEAWLPFVLLSITSVLRRRPVELSQCFANALPSSSRRAAFALRWAACETLVVPWVPGASDGGCIRYTAGGQVGAFRSVRVWQIGRFCSARAESPQGAAPGAQPRRRGRALRQLPPCQAVESGSAEGGPRLPGRRQPLAAPRDAARLHQTPSRCPRCKGARATARRCPRVEAPPTKRKNALDRPVSAGKTVATMAKIASARGASTRLGH